LCTPVAFAAIVEAIPRKAVRRRDIRYVLERAGRQYLDTIGSVSILNHRAERIGMSTSICSGHQARRTAYTK
jgi:hypothetical protein